MSPPRSTLWEGCRGVREFPATPAGYASLLGWLGGFGTLSLIGIEGTGSYGLAAAAGGQPGAVRADCHSPDRRAGPDAHHLA